MWEVLTCSANEDGLQQVHFLLVQGKRGSKITNQAQAHVSLKRYEIKRGRIFVFDQIVSWENSLEEVEVLWGRLWGEADQAKMPGRLLFNIFQIFSRCCLEYQSGKGFIWELGDLQHEPRENGWMDGDDDGGNDGDDDYANDTRLRQQSQ